MRQRNANHRRDDRVRKHGLTIRRRDVFQRQLERRKRAIMVLQRRIDIRQRSRCLITTLTLSLGIAFGSGDGDGGPVQRRNRQHAVEQEIVLEGFLRDDDLPGMMVCGVIAEALVSGG